HTERIPRVALYGRVSTTGQDPQMQLRELYEYADRRGWRVVGEYVDMGVSGAKDSRPELNRLMIDAVLAPQLAVQGVAVVGRIADHSFRPSTGETVLEGAFDEFRFMRRSAGNVAGDRKTMAVCDRHDFTAFSSASRADSSAPFFAELKLASMKVSDKSSLPRARRSSARACKSRVKVPSRCHCWKRRWQV